MLVGELWPTPHGDELLEPARAVVVGKDPAQSDDGNHDQNEQ